MLADAYFMRSLPANLRLIFCGACYMCLLRHQADSFEGVDESLACLQRVWDQEGPFDCVMGHSQVETKSVTFKSVL